jgi:hypothetical protein
MELSNDSSPILYTEWKSSLFSYKPPAYFHITSSEIEYFWILDGSAWPDLPRRLWELDESPNAWPLYLNTYFEEVRNAGPWFVPCKPGTAVTGWVLEQLEFNPLGLLVAVTKSDSSKLFDHFQQLLECILPNGQQGLYRYYDPRVFYAINTFEDQHYIWQTCRPSLTVEAWEPGRHLPIGVVRTAKNVKPCNDTLVISHTFLEHLSVQTRIHTVINTLGGIAGAELRSHPLPEAYDYVQSICNFLGDSPYQTRSDLAFAVAYSLMAIDDKWEDAIEEMVLKSQRRYDSLEQAFKTIFTA